MKVSREMIPVVCYQVLMISPHQVKLILKEQGKPFENNVLGVIFLDQRMYSKSAGEVFHSHLCFWLRFF